MKLKDILIKLKKNICENITLFINDHFGYKCKVCGVKISGYYDNKDVCNKLSCKQRYELRQHIDSIVIDKTRSI